MSTQQDSPNAISPMYLAGRQTGFGVAAVVLACVTFVHLLGAEKAILAIILGRLAMRGAPEGSLPRRLGIVSIVLGVLFIVTLVVVLFVFREKVMELIQILEGLS